MFLVVAKDGKINIMDASGQILAIDTCMVTDTATSTCSGGQTYTIHGRIYIFAPLYSLGWLKSILDNWDTRGAMICLLDAVFF